MAINTDWEYGNRKLAHYNKWLLDPNRPIDQRYPGFPEDIARERGLVQLKADMAKRSEQKAVAKAARAERKRTATARPVSRRTGGPTKLVQAVEIFRQQGGDKAAVIAEIQFKLGMSLAGATTYFYNAKKLAV